jgi:hypothetical protein
MMVEPELLNGSLPPVMISVIVRVDDKTHGLVGNSLERLLYLFDERRILIVHDHDSIVTD